MIRNTPTLNTVNVGLLVQTGITAEDNKPIVIPVFNEFIVMVTGCTIITVTRWCYTTLSNIVIDLEQKCFMK